MNINDILAIFGAKASVVIAGTLSAIIFVLLEIRQHSVLTAILAIISGVMVAALATTPILEFWNLPPSTEHAIAAVLGITGRNLIIWVGRASRDPAKFWATLRGKGGEE